MVAVEHALEAIEATQNRIMLTKVVIFPAQSAVVFALDMPILPTVATVHIDRCAAAAVNLFTFSIAMTACPALLIADDRPFAAGGIALEPGAPREVGAGLPRREGAARRWDPGECGACGGP